MPTKRIFLRYYFLLVYGKQNTLDKIILSIRIYEQVLGEKLKQELEGRSLTVRDTITF